jgi:hypothetical protein
VLSEAPPKSDPGTVGREIGLSNPNRMFGVARAPRPLLPSESVQYACKIDRDIKTGKLKDVADAIYSLTSWFGEVKQDKTIRRGRS